MQLRGRGLRELEDTLEWDPHPIDTIGQLVSDLVERLLEQKSVDQNGHVFGIFRQERPPSRGIEISSEEGAAHPTMPEARPRIELVEIFRAQPSGMAEQYGIGGRVERSDHACHV